MTSSRANSYAHVPFLGVFLLLLFASRHVVAADAGLDGAVVLQVSGRVELNRSGSAAWDPAQTNLVLHTGDGLRTGERSRATLRLQDATLVPVRELTTLRVEAKESSTFLNLLGGTLSFFHRDKPSTVGVKAGTISAIIRGTEFVASLDDRQRLTLVMLHGDVELSNPQGSISAKTGEVVEAVDGEAPRKSPGLLSQQHGAIQWMLYYPAVLDPSDLSLSPVETQRLAPVMNAYRRGAFREALDAALATGNAVSDSERLLRASLHLSAGQIPAMESELNALQPGVARSETAAALRRLVDIVGTQTPGDGTSAPAPTTVTGLLVESYARQAKGDLKGARTAAAEASRRAPQSGFAATRLAELQFGLGEVAEARTSLRTAMDHSPQLAAAWVLDGFLLAARGAFAQAQDRFNTAISLDPSMGDAWLGRGLMKLRRGDVAGGRIDMEAAAATEPQRAVLRSYLGKAFAEERNDVKALEEIHRARDIDAHDPTSWLYSALMKFRRNELSDAISDLEKSVELNDNRAIYRSRQLLDQDAAVRSANLAVIYEAADMADVSRRESARAVMFDYASASAHLNLAGSYNALRDPTRFNLRDETVWLNEHLLASLLSPTDGAALSQNLSQNEYSRLFAGSGFGLSGTTEYFSGGEIRQLASQVGNSQKLSYALDLDYQRKSGFRPNEQLSRIEWYTRIKAQLSSADSILLLAKYEDYDSGDNFTYADPSLFRPEFRFHETQAPMLLGGLHHEWSVGSHTLLLGGRLENKQDYGDRSSPQEVAFVLPSVPPATSAMDVDAANSFEIYTIEACHILERDRWTTVVGGRFQAGDFSASSVSDPAPFGAGYETVFGPSLIRSSGGGDFGRVSAYLYETWEPWTPFRVTGGISFDRVESPRLFRRPPFEPGSVTREGWSPKVALVYSPRPSFAMRAMYAESLGGVSYDESIRLEPTQLAGFPQAFRTLISESLVGSVEIPGHTAAGAAFDLKLSARTYLSLEGARLTSDVHQEYGMFIYDASRFPDPPVYAAAQDRNFDYTEHSATFMLHQILADEWFVQTRYRFTRSELDTFVPNLPAPATFERLTHQDAELHRVGAALLYQRTDGWFGRVVGDVFIQDNHALNTPAHEEFGQLSIVAGYRFQRQRGEIALGILNVTGRDYAMNPLTLYEELPRERTFYARLRFNF